MPLDLVPLDCIYTGYVSRWARLFLYFPTNTNNWLAFLPHHLGKLTFLCCDRDFEIGQQLLLLLLQRIGWEQPHQRPDGHAIRLHNCLLLHAGTLHRPQSTAWKPFQLHFYNPFCNIVVLMVRNIAENDHERISTILLVVRERLILDLTMPETNIWSRSL